MVLCESGIEGIEKIYLDGEELEPLQTIENYQDIFSYGPTHTAMLGTINNFPSSFAQDPISKQCFCVFHLVRQPGSGPTSNREVWLGIINPRTLQMDALGVWQVNPSSRSSAQRIAFNKQGELFMMDGRRFYKVNPAVPSDYEEVGIIPSGQPTPKGFMIDKDGQAWGYRTTRSSQTYWQFDINDPSNTASPYYIMTDIVGTLKTQLGQTLFANLTITYDWTNEQFYCLYLTRARDESSNSPGAVIAVIQIPQLREFTIGDISAPPGYFRRQFGSNTPIIEPLSMSFDQYGNLIVLRGTRSSIFNVQNLASQGDIQFPNEDVLPERSQIQFEGYFKSPTRVRTRYPTLTIRLFYDGINNQYDQSFLDYQYNENKSMGSWDRDHLLRGKVCALIEYQQIEYYSQFQTGPTGDLEWEEFPKIEFLVKGQKVKVPDVAEPQWSDNAAAIRRWWMENRRAISPDKINEESFKKAYEDCELLVDNALRQDEIDQGYALQSKRYTANGAIFSSDDIDTVENELDFCWDGRVIFGPNGEYLFRPGIEQQPSITLRNDDIISRGGVSLTVSRRSQTNSISMSLAQNEHDDFLPIDIRPYDDQALIERDGQLLPTDLGKRAFVTSPSTVIRLLAQRLRLNRLTRHHSYKLTPRDDFSLMGLIPSDIVVLNDSIANINNLQCRVLSSQINDDFIIDVVLQEFPPGVFSDRGISPTIRREVKIKQDREIGWPFSDTNTAYFYIEEAEVTIGDDVFTTSSAYIIDNIEDRIKIKILNVGGCVIITPGNNPPEELLLPVELPTITIDDIPAGDEGTSSRLGITLDTDFFDELTFEWSTTGGTIDDTTSSTPLLIRPNVDEDTTFEVSLTFTAKGNGVRYQIQQLQNTITTNFVVRDVPLLTPEQPNNFRARIATQTIISFIWDRVNGATFYEYRWAKGLNIDDGVEWTRTTANRFQIGSLQPGTFYTAQVRAGNSEGVSPFAETTERTQAPRSSSLTFLQNLRELEVTSSSIEFTWDEFPLADFYEYRYAEGLNDDDISPQLEWTRTDNTTVIITSLMSDTPHRIQVRGLTQSGDDPMGAITIRTIEGLPIITPPQVFINDVPIQNEGESVELSATIIGNDFDSLEYFWFILGGGTFDDEESPTPTLTLPSVVSNLTLQVGLTLLVLGTGQRFQLSEDFVQATSKNIIVREVDEAIPESPTVSVSSFGGTAIVWQWTEVELADFYEYRFAEGSSIPDNTAWVRTRETQLLSSGLKPYTQYTFQLRAGNANGVSPSVEVQQITSLVLPVLPPGNLRETDINPTSIRWDWDAVELAEFYEWRVGEGVSIPSDTAWTRITDRFILVESLKQNTQYTIEVRAGNVLGFAIVSSRDSARTALGVPGAVQNLRTSQITTRSITWNWNSVSLATRYEYRWFKGPTIPLDTSWTNTTNLSITLNNLDASSQYTFEVRAGNAAGTGGVAIGNTFTLPFSPQNVRATNIGLTDITYEWNEQSGVTYYEYIFGESDTIGSQPAGSWTRITGNTITFDSLRSNILHNFFIRAGNIGGVGQITRLLDTRTLRPPPSPPTNLREDITTVNSIRWLWNAVSDVNFYEYRVTEGNLNTVIPGTLAWTRTNRTLALISQLQPNTQYVIEVRSGYFLRNQVGDVIKDVATTSQVPAPPTPTNLRETTVGQNNIVWSWNASSGATYYEYRWAEGTTISDRVGWTRTFNRAFSVSSLKTNTQYIIQVRAGNDGGVSNAISDIARTLVPAPNPPTNLMDISRTDNSIQWTWTASPGATYYEVRFAEGTSVPSNTRWARGTTTSANLTGLKPSTTYTIEVRAGNASGISSVVRDSGITNVGRPNLPDNLRETATTRNSIRWAWDASTNATYYEYRRRQVGGSYNSWSRITNTYIVVSGLSQNRSYQIEVRAGNSSGVSAEASSIRKTPPRWVSGVANLIVDYSVTGTDTNSIRWEWKADFEHDHQYRVVQGSSMPPDTAWVASPLSGFLSGQTFGPVLPGTDYTFQIRKVDEDDPLCVVSPVATSTGRTLIDIGRPTNIVVSNIGRTSFRVRWGGVSGATFYQYRAWRAFDQLNSDCLLYTSPSPRDS